MPYIFKIKLVTCAEKLCKQVVKSHDSFKL